MSASTIRAKVQSGLAKAIAAVGSGTSDLVYKVTYTNSGGNTPLNPPVQAEVTTVLTNAIFKSYESGEFTDSIRAGDKELVSDYTVALSEGDIVKQGTTYYDVVAIDNKAPTSDTLAYISQVREK